MAPDTAKPPSLREDPGADWEAGLNRPARVCIVSHEFTGPHKTGGIGTAYTSLAESLAAAGHEVVALFTGWHDRKGAVENQVWRERYAGRGIELHLLGPAWPSYVASPHMEARRSWEAYDFVRARNRATPFDVIHYPETVAPGYYIAQAKSHGLEFADATLAVGVHSPTWWQRETGRQPITVQTVMDDFIERRSVELSDVLISPSAYMVSYLEDRGWRLPERRFVQQYVLPPSARGGRRPQVGRPRTVTELVFFGRWETRKGVEAFCEAVEILQAECPEPLEITFLGKPGDVQGRPATPYLEARAAAWAWPWRMVSDLDQRGAVAYLRERSCLAVMPSTVDNSPNTVYEALALEIAFIASASGGTVELVHPEDRERCTFDGWGEVFAGVPPVRMDEVEGRFSGVPLAHALLDVLGGKARPARFAVEPEENERVHVSWHGAIAAAGAPAPTPPGATPSLSACLVASEHGPHLADAAAALSGGGSGTDVVVACEDPDGPVQEGWRVVKVRQERPAEVLAALAQAAEGDWLLFLAGGHVPQPGAVETLLIAASRTHADALTFPVRDAHGPPREETPDDREALPPEIRPEVPPGLLLPLGGSPALGIFYDCYSASSFAIRRSALQKLGGFSDDLGPGEAAEDALSRLALSGGRIEVVPRDLATSRLPDRWAAIRYGEFFHSRPVQIDDASRRRLYRPYRQAIGGRLRDVPSMVSEELIRLAGGVYDLQWYYEEARSVSARVWEDMLVWKARAEELDEALLQAGEDLPALREALGERDAEIASLRRDLELVTQSRSWQLTSVLRAGGHAARRLRG